jgi:hypothetical protein
VNVSREIQVPKQFIGIVCEDSNSSKLATLEEIVEEDIDGNEGSCCS